MPAELNAAEQPLQGVRGAEIEGPHLLGVGVHSREK